MRLLTTLRRLDNQKKDRFILITTCLLTAVIVIVGFLYTKSSFLAQKGASESAQSTSTFSSFLNDAKATMSPAFSNIKEGVSSVSESYKNSSFKDFFIPKKDQN
jgi:hypothetical protein